MKQKIVIKVQMTSDKCRTKALKIAATTDGVNSVAIEGSDKDRLVVVGEGVDSANLTRSLRKKLCYAEILKVEEVKKKPPEPCCQTLSMCRQYPPFPMYCEPVQAPYSSTDGCVLM
ncbi:heavy metal-associated isoprenylated plant protein 47-like isoform X2 [Alnus glutinosa]|uniref:heavy metal-associated isoprenylated plant protein 47-like isoform X1 n=1 Tax=Alnus glutinosa TaxID=3517 RepID=UPI002D79B8EF|nr:heavy metal-associated isoprenylated plant protein 47-like isoform X1 [Alnus glutinosa]XP_062170166.1 heavy metal-associated isoprenylated plant protein 47-like isoform X2 [Alnus glutinosa]